MILVRHIVAAITLLLAAADVGAIELQRLEADDGNSFILIKGTFEATDNVDNELAGMVASRPVAFVTFMSPGGNPHAAMQLGRTIRRLGLSTVQIKTLECSSACTLAFLGGLNRFAEAGALGVHKSSFTPTSRLATADAVSAVQSLTSDIIGYLVEMDIDPARMQVALAYEADDMRYLSNREMASLRVVNGSDTSPVEVSGGTEATEPDSSSFITPAAPQPAAASVRHPSGGIMLRAAPDEQSAEVEAVWNATPVEILDQSGRWYRIRAAGKIAYAHESWIKVQGFVSAIDDGKYIQTLSFANIDQARAAIADLPYAASAYQVVSGWIAVTVAGKFTDAEASRVLAEGKDKGYFPEDAFKTFGNTYVQKVCCE